MFIRRIVLVLLVLNYSVGLAQAEWEEITGSDKVTVYIDPTTHRIDKKSGLVKMWILYDSFTVTKLSERSSFLSFRSHVQYDCNEERVRSLEASYFEGHMADGKVVFSSSTEGQWYPVAPGSIGETLWELACSIAKT